VGVDSLIKICSKCSDHKALKYETFSKDSQKEYGFQSQCRRCKLDYLREYNKIGRE